jgi:hypothetical protein
VRRRPPCRRLLERMECGIEHALADGPRRRGRGGREGATTRAGSSAARAEKREQPTPLHPNLSSFPTTSASIIPSRAHAEERPTRRFWETSLFTQPLCAPSARA